MTAGRDARSTDVHGVANAAGELVFQADSDAEAVRWWRESGRPGDYLADTGELLSTVASQLDLDDRCDYCGLKLGACDWMGLRHDVDPG